MMDQDPQPWRAEYCHLRALLPFMVGASKVSDAFCSSINHERIGPKNKIMFLSM